jgi:hypothetical protein
MATYLGKKEGLSSGSGGTLDKLGIAYDATAKSPALSSGVFGGADTSESSGGMGDCKRQCINAFRECLKTHSSADCSVEKRMCIDACAGTGGTPCTGGRIKVDGECVCQSGMHWNPTSGKCEGVASCSPPCGPNQNCVNGKCECKPGLTWDPVSKTCKSGGSTACPTPTGDNVYAPGGCDCGKSFNLPAGQTTCPTGYVATKKDGELQRCECVKWCKEIGWGEDCMTHDANGGEFEWSDELQSLWEQLMGRANTYLSMKPGYSEDALARMYGQNYDKTRQAGTATNQAMTEVLAQSGLLGTGTGAAMLGKNAWNTEQEVADLDRKVFELNEAQKREDLESFTTIANELFQSGMTYEQVKEAINAARRSESTEALSKLLEYLMSLLSSYNAA